jgi:hypothetical protein
MRDDDLLSQLGAFVREEERRRDPLLDKLVEGRATPEEVATLEQRAAGNPEAEAELERHRPIGEAVKQRVVARAQAELRPQATVVPLRRRMTWAAPTAALLAAAAAWMLMVRSPAIEALPGYSLEASGGVDTTRGEHHAERLVLAPDSRLELRLRPSNDIAGKVELRALLRGPNGSEPITLTPQVSPQGAMRVRVLAGEAFGARTGDHELLLITCRAEACDDAVKAAGNGTTEGPGYHILVQPLTLQR